LGTQLVLDELSALPTVRVVEHGDVLHMIDKRELFGTGVGYVDSHVLASVLLSHPAESYGLATSDFMPKLNGLASPASLNHRLS
jgi:hypothetical protein